MIHTAAVVAWLVLANIMPAIADETSAKPVDLTKAGTYTSGKWSYTLEIYSGGERTEKRTGILTYDGKPLDLKPQPNDYVRTPWGPLYWVGKRLLTWGANGWMPQPAEGKQRQGRELTITGLPLDEASQLPQTPVSGEITLGKEANGHYIEAVLGQAITIRLAGNPTTGYEWTAATPDDPAVVATSTGQYVKDSNQGETMGAGGNYVFRFRADRAGAAKITIYLHRSWEKTPAEIFSVLVRVSVAPRQ